MAKLAVLHGGAEIQSINLKDVNVTSLSIGRAEHCDVKLVGRAVGREHAVIHLDEHRLTLEKRSKYGQILVNGRVTDKVDLKPGDVIVIADYQVEVREGTKVITSSSMQVQTPVQSTQLSASHMMPKEVEPANAVEFGAISLEPAPLEKSLPISEQKTGDFEVKNDIESPQADEEIQLQDVGEVFSQPQSGDAQGADEFKLDLGSKVVQESSKAEPVNEFQVSSASDSGDKTAVITQEKVEAMFTFQMGAANVTEYRIEKAEVSIGRGSDCDIVLNDKTASRKHCIIKRVGVSYVLQDLGSGNGTLVNDHKVNDAELASGDKIQIGDTVFEFRAVNLDYVQQQHEYMSVPHDQTNAAIGMGGVDPIGGEVHDAIGGASVIPNQPGISTPFGIPGLGGAAAGSKKKETLLEKFRKLPPKKQIIYGLLVAVLLWFATSDGPKQKTNSNSAGTSNEELAFKKLSPEKRQFVVNTYQLAYDYYKNLDYNRALFEIKKVLEILPEGYKDSKDLKVYAEKAIEIEQAKLDEKHRKEEAERIRKEVAEFLVQAEKYVSDNKETEAREVFVKIFERDPENADALKLKQQLDERLERKRREEQARLEAAEKRKQLLELLARGKTLLKQEKFYDVIDLMVDAPNIGSADSELLDQAKNLAVTARKRMDAKTKPFLETGKRSLGEGNFAAARDAYLSAQSIDSKNEEAKRGLERVKEELRKISRNIYTEAVLLESISNLEGAKKKFEECLAQAMPGDIYFERCQRKLKRYQISNIHLGSSERGTASASPVSGEAYTSPSDSGEDGDPEMPTFNEDTSSDDSTESGE